MRLYKALEGVDEKIRLYEAGSIRDYNKTPSGTVWLYKKSHGPKRFYKGLEGFIRGSIVDYKAL